MKQRIEFSEPKSIGKPKRSNGNYEPYSEKKQINGHNQEKSNNNYPSHASHSHSPYQMQQNSIPTKLKTQATVPHVNQHQYIQIMELDFQAAVRGYEIKLKNLSEEYRRNKQEMENKLKELFQEKNHWQNLAIRYSQNFSTGKSQETDQLGKQKEKILKLQNEKALFIQQKEEISQQLKTITQQNSQLKLRIAELSKNDSKNCKYSSQPRINRSLTPPPVRNHENTKNIQQSFHVNGPQTPQKEFEMAKMTVQKLKLMVTDLNEQIIRLKIQNLNLKYEKDNGMMHFLAPATGGTNSAQKQTPGTFLSFNTSASRHKNK